MRIKCIHDSVCVLPYAQAHDIHAHVLLLCDWQTMSKYVFWKYCVQTLVLQTLELWLLISNATCLDCRYYHQTVDAGTAYPQWPHIRNTAPLNRTCSWCWQRPYSSKANFCSQRPVRWAFHAENTSWYTTEKIPCQLSTGGLVSRPRVNKTKQHDTWVHVACSWMCVFVRSRSHTFYF